MTREAMQSSGEPRIGYVVTCYPRYSETFIVNEILAHEAAGCSLNIFSLRRTTDTHFQNAISRVRAPVTYLPTQRPKTQTFWDMVQAAAAVAPEVWSTLQHARGASVMDVYQALALAHDVRRRGITHLHAHFANSAATVTRLAARFASIPYTFTAHARDIFHESVNPDELRLKASEAAAVVTVSDYNQNYLEATCGPAAARIERIYNGLELDAFPYRSPERRPPHIVAVGQLIEKKGFRHLIAACALLAERGRRFGCSIIGSGRLEEELRRDITRRCLNDVVELLGPRPHSDVIRLVHDAAVFAAPCVEGHDGDRDGLPTTLLEAMALGTPCVSTPVTGIPEAVRPGVTGLLVPEADPVALAHAIERLLDDAQLRAALAERARLLIEQQFDVRTSAARLRDVFASCAHSPELALRAAV
jgi:colanic acid/amylovoran biosynthesis glycosyltransferase